MLKFLKLIYGYVIILVRGENLERFLNLCKSRRIYMEKIRYREDGQLMAQMQAADFFRLRPLRNKTGVHIQIIQRRGMPFFFLRNKKRKAFFTGMILGGILIFFLTGRIWNGGFSDENCLIKVCFFSQILNFLRIIRIVQWIAARITALPSQRYIYWLPHGHK